MNRSIVESGSFATAAEYESLRQRALLLAKSFKEVEAENETLKQKYEQLAERYDRNSKVIDELIVENKEQEKIGESLQDENNKLRARIAEMEREHDDHNEFNEKICNKFREAYKASQDALLHRDMEIKKHKETIAAQNNEIDTLRNQMAAGREVYAGESANMNKALNDLIRKVENRDERIKSLEDEIQSERSANADNVGRLWKAQVTIKDLEQQLDVATKKLKVTESDLDYIVNDVATKQLADETSSTQYHYEVQVIGSKSATVYIEYGDKVYYPESFEDVPIYKDGSGVHRTLYYTTYEPLDINNKKCVLKSRDQRNEGYAPISIAQID